jgi:hypothetical protein
MRKEKREVRLESLPLRRSSSSFILIVRLHTTSTTTSKGINGCRRVEAGELVDAVGVVGVDDDGGGGRRTTAASAKRIIGFARASNGDLWDLSDVGGGKY